MLIDDIQKANIEAIKARDAEAKGVLSIIISRYKILKTEPGASNKEITDGDILTLIQKVLKELSDEKEGYIKVNNVERVNFISKQENVLKTFLPAQLSEEEIRNEIAKLDDKSLPSIMKHFKTNFAGKVDMSLVSQIARSL